MIFIQYIIAGELLKKAEDLLGQGVHTTVIVDNYVLAAKKSFEVLNSIPIKVPTNGRDILNRIAKAAMTGKWAESPEAR